MTLRFNPRWLLVFTLVFSFQFCRAQVVVPPSISFDLGTDPDNASENQLWDLQGAYQLDVMVEQRNGDAAIPMQLSFVLLQNDKGKLSNPTNDNIGDLELNGNSSFAVAPHITGKVTGSGGVAQVHFTIHFKGNGTLAGQPVNGVSGSLTIDAETDATTGLLNPTKVSKFSINFPHLTKIQGVIQDFAIAMPNGANASWNLTLQIVGLKKLAGTAVATTPNRALGFNLSGTLKNDAVKLQARGTDSVANTTGGKGLSATIQLADPFDSIVFKGKLLGQKMLFGFPVED